MKKVTIKTEPGVKMEPTAAAPMQSGQCGGRRIAWQQVQEPKFEGKVEELKGFIFECSDANGAA